MKETHLAASRQNVDGVSGPAIRTRAKGSVPLKAVNGGPTFELSLAGCRCPGILARIHIHLIQSLGGSIEFPRLSPPPAKDAAQKLPTYAAS